MRGLYRFQVAHSGVNGSWELDHVLRMRRSYGGVPTWRCGAMLTVLMTASSFPAASLKVRPIQPPRSVLSTYVELDIRHKGTKPVPAAGGSLAPTHRPMQASASDQAVWAVKVSLPLRRTQPPERPKLSPLNGCFLSRCRAGERQLTSGAGVGNGHVAGRHERRLTRTRNHTIGLLGS